LPRFASFRSPPSSDRPERRADSEVSDIVALVEEADPVPFNFNPKIRGGLPHLIGHVLQR
jgi:hypothetical protein